MFRWASNKFQGREKVLEEVIQSEDGIAGIQYFCNHLRGLPSDKVLNISMQDRPFFDSFERTPEETLRIFGNSGGYEVLTIPYNYMDICHSVYRGTKDEIHYLDLTGGEIGQIMDGPYLIVGFKRQQPRVKGTIKYVIPFAH